MASSQQIYALGEAISYTYHKFIAYGRRTKILYRGLTNKHLCAQSNKSNNVYVAQLTLIFKR